MQWWRCFGPPKQVFYPQCEPCSNMQGGAVKSGVAIIVNHGQGPWRLFPAAWKRWSNLTGPIVGMLPYFYEYSQ